MTVGGRAAGTLGAKEERTWLCCFWLFFLQPPVGSMCWGSPVYLLQIRAYLKRKKGRHCHALNRLSVRTSASGNPFAPLSLWCRAARGGAGRRPGSQDGQSLWAWRQAVLRQHVSFSGCLVLNRHGHSEAIRCTGPCLCSAARPAAVVVRKRLLPGAQCQ